MLTEGFSSTYSFPELLGGNKWANKSGELWKEMTSPGLKGDMAFWPPPTATCYCSVCFFNVFLISDIVWATSLPPTALYSQKKVQHFHSELQLHSLLWSCDRNPVGITLPKDPAPALELKKPLKRLAARFFQLSGPAPTAGREPPTCPRASGFGIFASPRNSVMFFLRRAWPCETERTDKNQLHDGP